MVVEVILVVLVDVVDNAVSGAVEKTSMYSSPPVVHLTLPIRVVSTSHHGGQDTTANTYWYCSQEYEDLLCAPPRLQMKGCGVQPCRIHTSHTTGRLCAHIRQTGERSSGSVEMSA